MRLFKDEEMICFMGRKEVVWPRILLPAIIGEAQNSGRKKKPTPTVLTRGSEYKPGKFSI